MMPKRRLADGLNVSMLGLGTVKLGRNTGVKYPAAFDLPSDSAIEQLLETARELGINLIDTAPAYGTSEERLGQLLNDREDWVLGTKCGEIFEQGQSRFDFSFDGTQSSLDQSRQRLNTDYLDYCLLHSDGNDLEVLASGAVDALFEARSRGIIRGIGISSKTIEGTREAIRLGLDIVMVALNAEDPSMQGVIQEAVDAGVGVLIKKAMASGHGSARENYPFILQNSGVSSIISGTLNPDHLRDNAAVVNKEIKC